MKTITVQEMIELLEKVEDKNKIVKYYDSAVSTGSKPVFENATHAYFSEEDDAFIILS